ncbi:MAG: UvrD-helicase domain-containing protein [Tetrasphaera sp.]
MTTLGVDFAPDPFDIIAPLPTGTTILEASAGTGKTWTISALVARYVAEGTPLDQLLVVTFGRAASQELRERVRDQLTRVEQHLADPVAHPASNRLEHTLTDDCSPQEIALRHRRIREALGAFDDATIATIHQFCQLVLRSLGVAGDTDSGATLVESLDDLLADVVADSYLHSFARLQEPPFGLETARRIAAEVVADPAAATEPRAASLDSIGGQRVAFALQVRAELDERKRRLGVLSYDDLLADLAAALEPPAAPARTRMRERWRVVLVDEFQDTDPVQWQVFERAFHGHSTMVLIGDPKQAIYAFRGGDIDTYLRARQIATTHQTLATNRRSDRPLVDAVGAALEGMALGDPAIVVHRVEAHREQWRLTGLPHPQPWRLRVARRSDLDPDRDSGLPTVGVARPRIARDAAADIKRLLLSGARFDGRPLQPRDIAVLCSTGHQLALVRDSLRNIGVPAVMSADDSVLQSPAALDWLTVLEAMESPNRSARVRAAALTPMLGVTAADLDARGEAATEEVAETMRHWAELFAVRGIPAVLEAAAIGGVQERLLRHLGGERELTDMRHTAELLHAESLRQRLGLVALTAWLRAQRAAPTTRGASLRSRRLDSDAAAVQLATIHGSKGLQFPIVYAPFLSDRRTPDAPDFPRYHDADGRRCLDVGGDPDDDVLQRCRAEDDGESLRLLYVALTRAQSQLVTWWTPMTTTRSSPLHRALFGRDPGGVGQPEPEVPVPSTDAPVVSQLGLWLSAGGPSPEWFGGEAPAGTLRAAVDGELSVRSLLRPIDADWRRTSYTALTRAAESGLALTGPGQPEPEFPARDDEAPGAQVLPESVRAESDPRLEAARGLASPMAGMPVGATFGSLVHAVLETADPQPADATAEFTARIGEQVLRWPVDVDREALAEALVHVSRTPLGPLAPGVTLADIPARDRLCELEFELPLGGGDLISTRGAPQVRLASLAPLLRAHLGPDDPLLPYAEDLARPELGEQPLRGYLTGSLDLVFRVGDRYLVADYKTNWLGPADAPLTAAHYAPEALSAAMQHSSYPLQALLYAVVLHRFLRWRVPAYDPESHLGGVLYLYLRGMCGPDTPAVDGHPAGVFSWRPPAALVLALSDLLDGRG